MKTSSSLRIEFEEERRAATLYAALLPEVRASKPGFAEVSMVLEGSSLRLEVDGRSLAAVRALLNSYIRWLSTSLEVMDLGD